MSNFIPNSFQVPNAFVDECMKDLSASATLCYLFIVRKTKGWQKEEDAIAISQFVSGTGLSNRVVIKACNELVKYGLINQKTGVRNTKIFSVNLCIKVTSDEKSHVTNSHTSSDEKSHVTCDEKSHTENNYIKTTPLKTNKDIKKNISESKPAKPPARKSKLATVREKTNGSAMDHISDELLKKWISHKKSISDLVLSKMIRVLDACAAVGITATDAVVVQLENDWQGIETEWVIKKLKPAMASNQRNNMVDPDNLAPLAGQW